jgi:hypothetical protein
VSEREREGGREGGRIEGKKKEVSGRWHMAHVVGVLYAEA